jgi:hypothetical protein
LIFNIGRKVWKIEASLFEDLIEASKASRGNLTVNSVKVDLHELALQACGEYEEKLRQAKLDKYFGW